MELNVCLVLGSGLSEEKTFVKAGSFAGFLAVSHLIFLLANFEITIPEIL
jgi:hypothetical protein